jgi:hypothetical protein
MLQWIVITALIVLFLHVTTWEGMIFEIVSDKLRPLPDYIKKPLYDCPICMAPWWGSVVLTIAYLTHSLPPFNAFQWVAILFAAGGLNTLLIYIISLCRDYVITVGEYYDKILNEGKGGIHSAESDK